MRSEALRYGIWDISPTDGVVSWPVGCLCVYICVYVCVVCVYVCTLLPSTFTLLCGLSVCTDLPI